MKTSTAEKRICQKSDLRALVTLSLPVDLLGEPFYMDRSPTREEGYQIEFYHCTNCGEQFHGFDSAEEHWSER